MSLYHWKPGTFSPEIEALAKDILGECICSESYKARDMCDSQCAFCREIETVERTRARVLAEVRESVEEIVLPMMETGIRSNTGIKILALFDKGGPLDPDTTHGKDQPCESK